MSFQISQVLWVEYNTLNDAIKQFSTIVVNRVIL